MSENDPSEFDEFNEFQPNIFDSDDTDDEDTQELTPSDPVGIGPVPWKFRMMREVSMACVPNEIKRHAVRLFSSIVMPQLTTHISSSPFDCLLLAFVQPAQGTLPRRHCAFYVKAYHPRILVARGTHHGDNDDAEPRLFGLVEDERATIQRILNWTAAITDLEPL